MGAAIDEASLARTLVIFLKRPVVDTTGLTGYYDFDVKWRAPDSQDGTPHVRGSMGVGFGQLNSVLQDQFGLQLKKSTGDVKHWVVDHIEPPTAN